jgi:hypothetical protein
MGGGPTTTSSSTMTSASTGTTGTGGNGTGGMDGGTGGLPLGSDCNQDSDCASMLCKPVVIDTPPVCVTPCTKQSDCGPTTNYFCEPVMAGSTQGYCIPHSPAHCLSCAQDSDCGSLSEVCFQATGDDAKACHVDCSIADQSACPSDYSCVTEMVNGTNRQVCRPKPPVTNCLDATGGYCDRLGIPQPCTRSNDAGSCDGRRACLTAPKRFDKCDAMSPQCKTDCSMQDPAMCTESYCAAATNGATNCGMLGNVCPGYQKANDNVTCPACQMCTFSCQGENYDVDGNPANGCEVPDAPTGNHIKSTALFEQQVDTCDNGNFMEFTISGHLPSDKRVHETPAVAGFDTTTGSAPDWYSIQSFDSSTFGTCQSDIVMQLCVQNSGSPGCYQLNVFPDSGSNHGCHTNGTGCCPSDPTPDGSCSQTMGICQNNGGQFPSGATIYIEVQKTCSASVSENPTYTITGHL